MTDGTAPQPQPSLEVTTENPRPAVAVLHPVGDVDTATTDRLRTVVDGQLAGGVRHLVLDLAGVEFLGSAGLALLVQQREAAIARDGALRIVAVPRAASRPLELTGLSELFDHYDDVDTALADLV